MGLIKAIAGAIGGGLADQWLEVLEPNDMGEGTVFVDAAIVRQDDRRSSNTKRTADVISNGSIIHVYDNQCMILVDGGKIVDYTAEPGYYKVDNSSAPSLFNGELGDAVKETFNRFKFGGVPSSKQMCYYVNLQEIKGIKFGTRTPVNYFDTFYNAELFIRAHGDYSIKITDPILFYKEAIPRNAVHVQIDDINEQYLSEFLQALQAVINQMSADGQRISYLPSKGNELSKYMASTLDETWKATRGIEVQAVGLASISYDEESQKLINMRNQGAMMGDPNIREGFVQSAVAAGMQAAGSNTAGAGTAFMGMGMGMGAAGGMAGFSATNQAQMQAQAAANGWTCACGAKNAENAKFCATCGAKKPEAQAAGGWTCACGAVNAASAKFCGNCGAKAPSATWTCACGEVNPANAKFCATCGAKKPE